MADERTAPIAPPQLEAIIVEHTRLIRDTAAEVLLDMFELKTSVVDDIELSKGVHAEAGFIVGLPVTGTIYGEYLLELSETTATAALGLSDLGHDAESLRRLRPQTGPALAEALNTMVGMANRALADNYRSLTMTSPHIAYGELHFPHFPAGRARLDTNHGPIYCHFYLDAARLRITGELEHETNLRRAAEDRILQRLSRVEALAKATESLIQLGAPDTRRFLRVVGEALQADVAFVLSRSGESTLTATCPQHDQTDPLAQLGHERWIKSLGHCADTWSQVRCSLVDSVKGDGQSLNTEISARIYAKLGVSSLIVAPLNPNPTEASAYLGFCATGKSADWDKGDLKLLAIARDILATDLGRREAEKRLQHAINHDQLTQLPNRSLIGERIHQALARMKRDAEVGFGVMIVGLDRFKIINDSLGHKAGDKILREASVRLVAALREFDVVARVEGDKFALLLHNIHRATDLLRVTYRIQAKLKPPFKLDERDCFLTAGIGICTASVESRDYAELLNAADLAMNRAKSKGAGEISFFDPNMHAQAQQIMAIESDLHRAIMNESFHLSYQPIFSLREARYVRVEALIRWRHHTQGLVSPEQFVPIAEETGLILAMDEWVLREASCKIPQMVDDQGRKIAVAVNWSARQLRCEELMDMVRSAIDASNIDPSLLSVELTENSILEDIDRAALTMTRLRKLGLHFSIDDFGTGYSSLAYVRRLPVSCLKIDKSFVDQIETNTHDRTIVSNVIKMAHELGSTVVAEGVETLGQLKILAEMGCDELQGYFLSRPLQEQDLRCFLAEPPAAELLDHCHVQDVEEALEDAA